MKKIALLTGLSGLSASAFAELPASVATSITEYQTDTLEAIGLVIVAGVAVWALMRLASKMGWR